MRAPVRRAVTGILLGLFASSADASPKVYETISPKAMLAILESEAGALKLDDSDGDTTLSGRVDGRPFEIYFYDCDGGGFITPARPDSACLGIEFRAYYEGYPNDAEIVNAWNNAHHYGALWRDDDEDLALQLNVIIEGGVTGANIRSNYKWWRQIMKSLDDFLAE